MPKADYRYMLDADAELVVELRTERGKINRYSVVLLTRDGDEWRTVRVYDNDLDVPHMHRYTHVGEKCEAVPTGADSPSNGYNMALESVRNGYRGMIDGWNH